VAIPWDGHCFYITEKGWISKMAKEFKIMTTTCSNIYNNNSSRELCVHYCEPEGGVTGDTGILILIPGFGANINSNVYKKMMSVFADRYNLVTVQCEYFGQRFMWEDATNHPTITLNMERVKDIITKEQTHDLVENKLLDNENYVIELARQWNLVTQGILDESLEEFNDMGILQAIDNVIAVLSVADRIKQDGQVFNKNKIIAYGHSHGAYLAYLCNAFTQNMFALVIDNSAWLFPAYLTAARSVLFTEFSMLLHYLAKQSLYDEELLNLKKLYKKFDNKCKIMCFHGVDDNLTSLNDKKEFGKKLNRFIFKKITKDHVDGKIFKSTNHGLDADFLELFDHAMNKQKFIVNNENLVLSPIHLKTQTNEYIFDYYSSNIVRINPVHIHMV
jgi:hypothetical protein